MSLLFRSLGIFFASSGLVANSGKSNIYYCNISNSVKDDIIKSSSFVEGSLPFKYLGVNVSTKKLSVDDCQCLIDKVTQRVR